MEESNSNLDAFEYLKPEEKIYDMMLDGDKVDWKAFLYQLIYDEGLNPWDVDLGILTKRYLEVLKSIKKIDFNISGKFLTIAIFLLKTKAENLVEKDLRGMEEKIASVQETDMLEDNFETLEDFDNQLDELIDNGPKNYSLKIRNPIARKRRIN